PASAVRPEPVSPAPQHVDPRIGATMPSPRVLATERRNWGAVERIARGVVVVSMSIHRCPFVVLGVVPSDVIYVHHDISLHIGLSSPRSRSGQDDTTIRPRADGRCRPPDELGARCDRATASAISALSPPFVLPYPRRLGGRRRRPRQATNGPFDATLAT